VAVLRELGFEAVGLLKLGPDLKLRLLVLSSSEAVKLKLELV
jgi:hypothetical protein